MCRASVAGEDHRNGNEDQAGASPSPELVVTWLRFEPSALIVKISEVDPGEVRELNMSFAPFGDQVADPTKLPTVSGLTPEPSTFTR